MIRLLVLAVLATFACRLIFGRWPWELLKQRGVSGPEARARVLLGVRKGASREEIIEAHRRHVAQVHPDRGGTNELVHEINAARDLLLGGLARRNED